MPTHSNQIAPHQPIPASRKAVIYLGMAISTAGVVVFLSGFFTFGAGFIEFIKPDDTPSMPRSNLGQSFEQSRRQSDEWWSQVEAQGRKKEQVFSQMVAATLPRWFGGIALMAMGGAITAVGKKGITRLAEEDPKQHSIGFYIEKYFNEGGTMNDGRSINIQATSGSNVVYAGNDISGTVTTTINQLQQTPEPNAMQLMELLRQLQQVIETEASLNVEDKADALEQVKVLAEAGQNPRENTMQKAARNAIKILRGTATAMPPATEFLKACNTLLPTITQLLGLAL
ncbi:MAG TPA: hypothetical protein V6C95_10000 [Coleofasciculaceae cyanobacterium]